MKNARALKLIRNGKGFCIVPWIHFHVPSSGPIVACCEATAPLGTVHDTGIAGVWNGQPMRALRRRFLADERDPGCHKCYEKEESGARSLRNMFNDMFLRHLPRLAATADDGSLTASPISWDLRLSNLCNYRCRMCGHASSSRWFDDAKALQQLVAPQALLRSVGHPTTFIVELQAHLASVESIYFAGGEPLLMEEHFKVLDLLARSGLRHVSLTYSTNLSALSFRDYDVLELWNQLESVTLCVSVDGVGKRGELIRKGLDWDLFSGHVRRVRECCPHVRLMFSVSVQALNVLHLPDLHATLVQEFVAAPHEVRFQAVQEPSLHGLSVLTPSLKRAAALRLDAHLAWLDQWYESRDASAAGDVLTLRRSIQSLYFFLDQEPKPGDREAFIAYTEQLDQLRGESTATVFPELACMLGPGRSVAVC